MSIDTLTFQEFVGTTADEQRWQICNSILEVGSGGNVVDSDVAVASDGLTRSPLNLDSKGRLIVDIGSSIQLDSITVDLGQVESLQAISNALLTTIQSDLAGTLNSSVTNSISLASGSSVSLTGGTVSLASGSTLASSGNSTISGVGAGVTLPVSGTFYQATQPVSGNVSLTGGNVSLTGGTVSLASGSTLASSGNSTISGVGAGVTLPVSNGNLDTLLSSRFSKTDTISGGLITLNGSNATLPVSGTFYQATQPVSGNVSLTGGNVSLTGGLVSLGAGGSSGTLIAGAFNKASGSGTISGGSVTAGSPVSLPSATKNLTISNNSSSAQLYISTSTLPSATNGIALSAGVGVDLSYIINSTIYVNSSSGTANYGVAYA